MIEDLITPLSESQVTHFTSLPANRWGNCITYYREGELDYQAYDLAIVGVYEDRGSVNNDCCSEGPDFVRRELYQLVKGTMPLKLIDLGNINPGAELSDTYFALSSIVYELLKNKVLPIVIGGSHDLTLSLYRAYSNLEQPVNMVCIDERMDMSDLNGPVTDENFLMTLFSEEPSILAGFTHLGYQSYFTDPEAIHTLEKLRYESYRLGEARKNMEDTEPLLRDADIVSFDVSAIKQADAPGHRCASPNGFAGEEACQMLRYAGLSDQLTCVGIFGYNPTYDNHTQTAQLLAQMVWYFAEGYYGRKGDNPNESKQDYLKYIVDFNNGEHELVFWKSKRSERWWLQAPSADGLGHSSRLISCTYGDYQQACQDELPERWLKAFEKV